MQNRNSKPRLGMLIRYTKKTTIFASEMKNGTIHINRFQSLEKADSLKGFYPIKLLGRSVYFGLKSSN